MQQLVLDFLKKLEKNNNREWFAKNKPVYEKAMTEFTAFVDKVIPLLAVTDPSVQFVEAKDCMFRIYRDVRFSKDKSPYKTNFGAWITKGGRKSPGPGYYFHLSPEECFIAGGIHMPEPDTLKKIRQEIFYNGDSLHKILESKDFKKFFSGIDDWDKQKLPPRDYPKDFKYIDLLKHRSFTVSHVLTEDVLDKKDLGKYVVNIFGKMKPFNDFLRLALEG
jgi:uncharacterized protein (TIGR02453 family)